eukprot:gnl/MRDRNA2_/MRDRNA2_276951_c0_seq1.p1 gnl/MRDRNA2_/MRDRNA2_276951_c0~~gnl/MRDRNA2_/MRDRNA2_276951_c0_seq1.p1  ORF type:complete len:342 (-),score=54.31 gnl/MRDRNA2_/MRDRNA2_276951_c0_seq1:8-1033(-)
MQECVRIHDHERMHDVICHLNCSQKSNGISANSLQPESDAASVARSPGKTLAKSSNRPSGTSHKSPQWRARDMRARRELDEQRAEDTARIQKLAEFKRTDCEVDMNELLNGIRGTSTLPGLAEERWRLHQEEKYMRNRKLQQDWEANVYQPIRHGLENAVTRGLAYGGKPLRQRLKESIDDPVERPTISFNQEQSFKRTAERVLNSACVTCPDGAFPNYSSRYRRAHDSSRDLLSTPRGMPSGWAAVLDEARSKDLDPDGNHKVMDGWKSQGECPREPKISGTSTGGPPRTPVSKMGERHQRPTAASSQKQEEGQAFKHLVSMKVTAGEIQSFKPTFVTDA